ncbi:2-isopropylmalate synthase [archaeon]|jgi:(R)-citramalate synthase|nr:2-isopropylmalate synthase [archaeon]MBT6821094.1 2-isopropylmalate synthase [archaeon]
MKKIEIMDTTLRDGEQTNGVSFTPEEKLAIAKKLILDVKVDRIEIGNALASVGEKLAMKKISNWAKEINICHKIEILGFVDRERSVDWIKENGCSVINLLTKGSLKHCNIQLKKTAEEHFEDIKYTIKYANEKGLDVNVYLEDWSNGILENEKYVLDLTNVLNELNVKRIMLPDTLGIFNPQQIYDNVKLMVNKFPEIHFDIHVHNDYGLATANALSGISAGAKGIHVTVNCLGERAGNAALDEVCVCLKDFYDNELSIDEKKLKELSKLVETFSGKKISSSKPISGEDVFTQTAGIHADGDKKGNLYITNLYPDRFGRERIYALGKMSGKASLEMNLKDMNIELDDDQKKQVLKKIVELGDKKEVITKEDLPFIISDILKNSKERNIKVIDYDINSIKEKEPIAKIKIKINDIIFEEESIGNGGYNAFMNCIKKLKSNFGFDIPKLADYTVRIPPGGNTDALVQTIITWKNDVKEFKTIGVDSDQIVAAIKATEKMLNFMNIEK